VSNTTVKFYPKRNLIKPAQENQLKLATALTVNDVTEITVESGTIPLATPTSGFILVQNDFYEWRRISYEDIIGDSFIVNLTESDDDNDFEYATASVGRNVWISDLDIYSEYAIQLTLSQFNQSPSDRTMQSESLSGREVSSLFNAKNTYSCEVKFVGVNDEVSTEEFEMFRSSVMNKEDFIHTNLDEDDREMTVTMANRGSRDRIGNNYINKYNYQYSISEVLDA